MNTFEWCVQFEETLLALVQADRSFCAYACTTLPYLYALCIYPDDIGALYMLSVLSRRHLSPYDDNPHMVTTIRSLLRAASEVFPACSSPFWTLESTLPGNVT